MTSISCTSKDYVSCRPDKANRLFVSEAVDAKIAEIEAEEKKNTEPAAKPVAPATPVVTVTPTQEKFATPVTKEEVKQVVTETLASEPVTEVSKPMTSEMPKPSPSVVSTPVQKPSINLDIPDDNDDDDFFDDFFDN